ncbi:MAG TPA: hypothetical protein PLR92_15235, partial [Alicycliphilus denitrificans]|nr:hypothetical protein [Alicycliphilus denitrificans]
MWRQFVVSVPHARGVRIPWRHPMQGYCHHLFAIRKYTLAECRSRVCTDVWTSAESHVFGGYSILADEFDVAVRLQALDAALRAPAA